MLRRKLEGKRVVFCLGAGGVGKTTVAAALGIARALEGHRTAVITVDPARRLRDALGLASLSSEPTPVPLPRANGTLDALAVHPERTLDALLRRLAPTPEIADRLLTNRLYRGISAGIAGSAEYAAVERLCDLARRESYDTVVVDTPPGAHAGDLLRAPYRLGELVGSRALGWLKAPATLLGSLGPLRRLAVSPLLRILERWTGVDLLREMSELAGALESFAPSIGARAREIEELLRSDDTAFLLVTTPEPHAVETTLALREELARERLRPEGIVANRVVSFPPLDLEGEARLWPEPLRRRLRANYSDLLRLSRRDARALRELGKKTSLPILAVIPALPQLPVSVPRLEELGSYLGSPDAGAS
ncbi:MAG: hypothetical protein KatS3mg076_2689 [Candidatus Binatia bacterium]|nr:MAG: hypothetical protein KatS3mg076_2689 [Candidatus Binatia bacterium]